MVTQGYNDMRELPFEALVRVVNACPWFGAAQKALSEQMIRLGGRELSRRQMADAALHVASRGKIAELLREEVSCTDVEIALLLKKYVSAGDRVEAGAEAEGSDALAVELMEEDPVTVIGGTYSNVGTGRNYSEGQGTASEEKAVGGPEPAAGQISVGNGETGVNRGFRGVGDYFSREQYEEVRRGGYGYSGNPAAGLGSGSEQAGEYASYDSIDDFCTEAIAGIYAEQGYFDRAKEIYAKLILEYPEKSAYFAALIEKLNDRHKN